ncbi:MAG: hypothetical protein A2X94_07375 [Bdellovibrionales bacterium GWB1_55_8]|nr:MAG: hypothetical protein A2X94_07375 [Bdellovibrionales bacterium GWB1_55_8]
MKRLASILGLMVFVSALGGAAKADDIWVGNFAVQIERGGYSGPCEPASPLGNGTVSYDSWARQRATVKLVCFEVYRKDVTEYFRSFSDIDRYLGLRVYRIDGGAPSGDGRWGVSLVGRRGNNAVYALDLSAFDPFSNNQNPQGDQFEQLFMISVGEQDPDFAMRNQEFTVIYKRY